MDQLLSLLCVMSFALFSIGTIGLALISAFKDIDPDIPQIDVPGWDRETLKRNNESEA